MFDDRDDAEALEAFGEWFESEYSRLTARAALDVPESPAPEPDAVATRIIARGCGQFELVFVPSKFHYDAKFRKNEILALIVLDLARAYGREFRDAAEARAVATRILSQTADEDKVKTAFGATGAFLTPLLSPDMAKRAWRIFTKVPFWGKVVVGAGLVTVVVALPMLKPLSLGVLARREFQNARAVEGGPAEPALSA